MTINSACNPSEETPKYNSYVEYPVYENQDLGLNYTPQQSIFKVYSPAVEAMRIHFYDSDLGGKATRTTKLHRLPKGIWQVRFQENLLGKFYTFQAKYKGKWLNEVPDPYVKAVGRNGKRGQIIDFKSTNPIDWKNDQRPTLTHFNDIIIWEMHVRDISIHKSSGIKNKGKFLGLTETGTRSPEGEKTGLDHIKDLGVTHVQLLPSFDFYTIDETRLDQPQFNWGYDPQNYNVPEGSYTTNPADGTTRIREFKAMVKAFHDNGIRVILDVVYNHTGVTEESAFNQLTPGYYYRYWEDDTFSNASGCGNEIASERPMVRKFMLESMKYWIEEYHLDGFRVDLMGIHDIETMNWISEELQGLDATIFIYGEGWTAGDSPLPESKRALKKHIPQLQRVAAFSDDIRDGLKGSVFNHKERGFVSGQKGTAETIKFGVVASTQHPQVDYQTVNYSNKPWANQPSQTITYVSCHDNHTLWDRLQISNPEYNEAEQIKMHQLAGAIVLTSQGVSFIHAGMEFLRTKFGEENSYRSPDSINQLVWTRKTKYKEVYEFYKKLIQLRKNHPAFRMPSTSMIQQHLEFIEISDDLVVAYQLKDHANGDSWKNILVFFNGNATDKSISLPSPNWQIVMEGSKIDEEGLGRVQQKVTVPSHSAVILIQSI